MIVVTGGAGFIGSALIWKLNGLGRDDIVVVDRLGVSEKWRNLLRRRFAEYLHKDAFIRLVLDDRVPFPVEAVVHLGACSSTTERDADYLMENNVRYTRRLAEWALTRGIRFLYASSAATYGDGSRGFSDDDAITPTLEPINRYGWSKQLADAAFLREGLAKRMAGIKFFNVFGPNEYHKGEMTSVVFQAFHQIREAGRVRLFRSYRAEYPDGGQMRDFVYVKDCVEVLCWFLEHPEANGIFNLGTGKARTWNDLMAAVFSALDRPRRVEYIDMPDPLKDQYQYFTQARMDKLRASGCTVEFHPLEESVRDYVTAHLARPVPFL